jgi:thymidylate synthase
MDKMFCDALTCILSEGRLTKPSRSATSPHSRFGAGGAPLIEVQHWHYQWRDVHKRLLHNRVRSAWLDQAIGLTLWQFGGAGRLKDIQFYNPAAEKFSDDGVTLRASWGQRLFGGSESIFARCISLLQRDPETMRAVACISWPEDSGVESKDVPCLISIHFLIRDGSLELICHLRALNPYWVFPYDHFFLTVLLEYSASILGLAVGTLNYTVNSLHLSITDRQLVEAALEGGAANSAREMPVMAPRLDLQYWDRVNESERHIRVLLDKNMRSQVLRKDWEAALSIAPDDWSIQLLQALVHAYTNRRGSRGGIDIDCPTWAAAYLSGMAISASGSHLSEKRA